MIISIIFLAIAIISSLDSTQSHRLNQGENTCNACCQGEAGIPGPAGDNGLPGQAGLRGEPGPISDGQKGQKGDQGFSGAGLPGMTGPKGSIGASGPAGRGGETGLHGLKGQKGESAHTRKSAFTATKTSAQTGNINNVVTFQTTTVNINNHFSLSSNKFICQIPGVYVFMFSMGVFTLTDPHIQLVKNNILVVTGHTRTLGSNDFDQTGNSALLNLQAGDQVWLKFGIHNGRVLHGDIYKYSSFSGFLLYEM